MDNSLKASSDIDTSLFYEKTLPIRVLKWHHCNVRDEQPTPDLVDSIGKHGFLEKNPIIVVECDDGKFGVVDGWQRFQAAIEIGHKIVPCEVYYDLGDAMTAAGRASIQKPWTVYQKIKHHINLFEFHLSRGLSGPKAFEETLKRGRVRKSDLARYLDIWELPPLIRVLLKKIDNRTQEEESHLKKICPTIRQHNPLSIRTAHLIFEKLGTRRTFQSNPEKLLRVAIAIMGRSKSVCRRAIEKIERRPHLDPFEIVEEIEGYNRSSDLNVGIVELEPFQAQLIKRILKDLRKTPRELIKMLLEKLIEEHYEEHYSFEDSSTKRQ